MQEKPGSIYYSNQFAYFRSCDSYFSFQPIFRKISGHSCHHKLLIILHKRLDMFNLGHHKFRSERVIGLDQFNGVHFGIHNSGRNFSDHDEI